MGLWRIVCECCPLRDDAGEFPGGPVVMTAGGRAWILSGGTESLHAPSCGQKNENTCVCAIVSDSLRPHGL